MSIQPHSAAAGMLEAGEDAQTGVTRSGEHEWQPAGLQRAPDERGEPTVHLRRGARGVAKRHARVGPLDGHGDAPRREQLVGAGFQQAPGSIARRVAVVAAMGRNLDQANVQITLLGWVKLVPLGGVILTSCHRGREYISR
jgi:hypothetical protein